MLQGFRRRYLRLCRDIAMDRNKGWLMREPVEARREQR